MANDITTHLTTAEKAALTASVNEALVTVIVELVGKSTLPLACPECLARCVAAALADHLAFHVSVLYNGPKDVERILSLFSEMLNLRLLAAGKDAAFSGVSVVADPSPTPETTH